MDSRMRRSLDSYIMGEHLTRREMVNHRCPKCKQEWRLPMVYDMGGWFYEEQEPFCTHCEIEMEIVEEG